MSVPPATESAPVKPDPRAPLARLEQVIDSVYFLMYEGWEKELESNRWHFARRWARHFPVVLLQPQQRFGRLEDAVPTDAIDNCEILPVVEPSRSTAYALRGLVQAAQVMEQMGRRGHSRPLLWCYNPLLAGLYAAVPAVARVYHASENYFDFEGMPDFFYQEVEAALRISDLVLPVSSGVEEGIRARVPDLRIELVTNGCDTSHYQPAGAAAPDFDEYRASFERVAVFAGNINSRIDFGLVSRAAEDESTLLVFAGPVGSLPDEQLEAWRRILRRKNVRHLGRMSTARLAAIYRSSDLGFIPYRRERLLVQNGFPLKTLEMAATGLPVVTSYMQPIAGLASSIVVAEDDTQFLDSFGSLSRSALTDGERLELLELAAANDYDLKFEQVIGHVTAVIPDDIRAGTRLDELLGNLGYETWRASCKRMVKLSRPSFPWRFALRSYEAFASVVPHETRVRLIPLRVREWGRSHSAD